MQAPLIMAGAPAQDERYVAQTTLLPKRSAIVISSFAAGRGRISVSIFVSTSPFRSLDGFQRRVAGDIRKEGKTHHLHLHKASIEISLGLSPVRLSSSLGRRIMSLNLPYLTSSPSNAPSENTTSPTPLSDRLSGSGSDLGGSGSPPESPGDTNRCWIVSQRDQAFRRRRFFPTLGEMDNTSLVSLVLRHDDDDDHRVIQGGLAGGLQGRHGADVQPARRLRPAPLPRALRLL
jgi:hypothetical protein